MSKQKISTKLFSTAGLSVLMVLAISVSVLNLKGKLEAQSIDGLRGQSQQIQDDIANNQAAADKKHKHADNLQGAVNELDGQISAATQQIGATAGKIDQLTADLKQKQKDLIKAKKLLKLNMQALYKRGDASEIELIVGSDSFSDYIDEQEYLERVKTGIQDAAKQVIELKKQIKSQRDQKKEELAKQEAARSSLGNLRSQRADLLEKTRGEEAEYKEIVEDLKDQRAAVDQQITALIQAAAAQSSGGGGGSSGGVVGGGGQIIGRVGTTGFSTGCHLHFEMRNSSGQVINPRSAMGIWPVSGSISQEFGNPSNWYVGGFHPGIDIVTSPPCGVPVRATKPGRIFRIPNDPAYGNLVIIKHNDGTSSVYGHLSSF